MINGDEKPDVTDAAADVKITSLAQYASLVADKAAENEPLWFRGISDSNNHKLMPSLYRGAKGLGSEAYLKNEVSLIETFRYRSPPFLDSVLPQRDGNGDLQTLFIMQHHGIPTRLLDWTENPFVALYFALLSSRKSGGWSDAAVWILRPQRLNAISMSHVSRDNNIILPPNHANLRGYWPGAVAQTMPVAMFGVHNSRRIVAQRGVFVLFGSEVVPMDDQAAITGGQVMERLVIDRKCLQEIHRTLFQLGFTDSVIFPDLDGLAREVSFQHGY